MSCAWLELLSRIPVSGIRLPLSRWHLDGCTRCRQESDLAAKRPLLLIAADRLPAGLDLWPAIRQGIAEASTLRDETGIPALLARRSWRLVYAAALLGLALLVGFLGLFLGRNMRPHAGPVDHRPPLQTRLCSAKIANRPAKVFQVQSRNPDRSIFWIAKNEKRS